MNTIALDAHGGDCGPEVLVPGALRSLRIIKSNIILVGDKERLRAILKK